MKLKQEFVITEIGDKIVAVPVGEADGGAGFRGVVYLNETAAVVWRGLIDGLNEQQIAEQFIREYDVDMETALSAVRKVIAENRETGFLEDAE